MNMGVLETLSKIFAGFSIIFSVMGILMIVANWKLFTKAGREGWKSIIPFLNLWTQAEIAGMKGFMGILPVILFPVAIFLSTILTTALGEVGSTITMILIPIASIAASVIMIMMLFKYYKSFGASTGLAIVVILFPILVLLLGFSNNYQYAGADEYYDDDDYYDDDGYGGYDDGYGGYDDQYGGHYDDEYDYDYYDDGGYDDSQGGGYY